MPVPFAVTVLQYQQVRLVGVSIHTTLHKAPVDCPRLWSDVFAHRMPELSGKAQNAYQGPSYGVSVFTDHKGLAFNYWAAMEAPDIAEPPMGMSEVILPGGLYACCRIPAPGMLREAYDYMYDVWPQTAEGFPVQVDKPCFERYDSRFFQSGTHDVYVPILPR
ncbi:AraC family transcriptional regulator [Desulfovibrio desulfuricans]|uniref:AraC family transcriptional regulator n=1 Tax=Desulfovibrio desulfuricans TaxID=876 RepID=A0A4P7USS4_DESDE|nr:GyrI-like domain-containing protein [Desulfovibrio desulfuricans]QCC86792.1 AraC family transcriptional regulator [Desulfovibrio desulfuricans]